MFVWMRHTGALSQAFGSSKAWVLSLVRNQIVCRCPQYELWTFWIYTNNGLHVLEDNILCEGESQALLRPRYFVDFHCKNAVSDALPDFLSSDSHATLLIPVHWSTAVCVLP